MRQSIKSRVWQLLPVMTAGERNEAFALARAERPEDLDAVREVKPFSKGFAPRPGS
ncbi:hypothetical protein [Paenibacillus sp. DYY-L-2]|uniref:hypothetical protein n=1 Tax=Paenibacillus sp. DYY-L-2 TaxID=3447013 RepID=UPI003F4FF0C2